MKLELKHLAPYLAYGLKFLHDGQELTLFGLELESNQTPLWITGLIKYQEGHQQMSVFPQGCEPILRPLSDLNKEIEINGKKFIPIHSHDFKFGLLVRSDAKSLSQEESYRDFNKLIEWHFDVFGLIEDDLAIDINTIDD